MGNKLQVVGETYSSAFSSHPQETNTGLLIYILIKSNTAVLYIPSPLQAREQRQ